MRINKIENKQNLQMGPAGLSLVGQLVKIIKFERLAGTLTVGNPKISNFDVLASMCGLLSQGKTDYAHIEGVVGDKFFMNVLGIRQVPSQETYRQRLKAIALNTNLTSLLPSYSVKLWKRLGMSPVYIEKDSQQWMRIDVDPVIYDNSDTKKEGAAYTYNKQFGFAAIFAHLDGGWMVNADLLPGNTSFHGSEATSFINQSLDFAEKMSSVKKLLVTDCGFDNQSFLSVLLARENTDFIVKHNKRRESNQRWLAVAKEQGTLIHEDKSKGYRLYRGSTSRQLSNGDQLRLVFEVRETFVKNGRQLLVPEVSLFSAWTSLESDSFTDEEVLHLYRLRGTSEQYHAEFKSEMDMERPPSENLTINNAFLRMGMLTHNMLKVIALDLADAQGLGLKTATRRRIRTVINSVILMAGRVVKGGRYLKMQLACSMQWFVWFCSIFQRFKSACA